MCIHVHVYFVYSPIHKGFFAAVHPCILYTYIICQPKLSVFVGLCLEASVYSKHISKQNATSAGAILAFSHPLLFLFLAVTRRLTWWPIRSPTRDTSEHQIILSAMHH